MKKLILAVLAATTLFALSGCGSDNNAVFLPTSSTITFSIISTSTGTVVPLQSTATGAQYIHISAALPSFNNVSTTTAPAPTSGQFPGFLNGALPITVLPAGAKRISPSALVAAGPFANNSSVSKRTKINGYITTDPLQGQKRVSIFLVYSSPRTPGAVLVRGSSVEVAKLRTTFPAGSEMSDDLVKKMNQALWQFQTDNAFNEPPVWSDNFKIYNPARAVINVIPTISSLLLGF